MQQFIKCLLAVLLLLLASVNATVTIIETGQSYATRPDNSGLGKEFYSGYEYMGRLQWIHGNLPLCDDSQIYNVTVPYDGLFVALVVRGGGCSLQQKLKVATNNIHPAGVVKYILIDGKNPDEEIVYSNDNNNNNNEYMQDFRYTENDESVIIFDPDDDTDSTLSHKKHSARKSDDIIPAFSIYILHISYKTEYALLDRLLKQTQESFTDGGPRIALDSRLGTGIWNGPLAVWMALCIFVSACACSCLVILGNESINFEHDQMPPRPPVRRERPRLSRDQIRQRLPVYQYPHEAGPLLAEDVENNNTNNQELVVPPLSNELELCTICLDEYEPGDRLRCLPCRHVFHANCIGKWLHERSATCPLCKIDLWEEEEEESDDEEEASLVEGHEARPQVIDDNTASQQQSWWSAIFWRPPAASTTTTTPEQEMTETHSDTAVEPSQQQQSEEDFPRGSWWRRMFPVSNTTTETRASLTEPLLSLQEEVVEREDSNGNEEVTQNEEACTGDADEEVTLQPGQVLV